MKYRRLKTVADHSFVLRYYPLKDTVAYANAIYEIGNDGKATKVSGTPTGKLVGFSHGGNNLAKGMILLDINTQAVYMGLLEAGDTRPAIGDVVNGCQKVIDTHYDGDEGVDGKNDFGFGVETLDNPYYLFHLIQPESSSTSLDDSTAGEISGVNEWSGTQPTPTPTTVTWTLAVRNVSPGVAVVKSLLSGTEEQVVSLNIGESTSFNSFEAATSGTHTLAEFGYEYVKVYASDGETEVVDVTNYEFTYENQTREVAVPTINSETP